MLPFYIDLFYRQVRPFVIDIHSCPLCDTLSVTPFLYSTLRHATLWYTFSYTIFVFNIQTPHVCDNLLTCPLCRNLEIHPFCSQHSLMSLLWSTFRHAPFVINIQTRLHPIHTPSVGQCLIQYRRNHFKQPIRYPTSYRRCCTLNLPYICK